MCACGENVTIYVYLRLQGAQLYLQMASGLSERKDRFKKKMGYLWTAQTKEPEQR